MPHGCGWFSVGRRPTCLFSRNGGAYLSSAWTAFGVGSRLLHFEQALLAGFEKRASNLLLLRSIESRPECTAALGQQSAVELSRDLSGLTNGFGEGFEFCCGNLPRERGCNIYEGIGHQ